MSSLRLIEPNPFQLPENQFRLLNRWRYSTFFVMLIGYIGYYLCRANLPAAFPLMNQSLGFSYAQLGSIALFSELAYAIGKFINGPLADRVGGRRIFLVGMAGAIVCNFIFAISTHLLMFIIVWCACRYFLSMGWGGLTKVIGNWFEPERNGTVMGWMSLNFQFGGVVATLLAGGIIALGGSWQDVFIYPPLVLLVILVWSVLASRDSPQQVLPGTPFGKSPVGRQSLAAEKIDKDPSKTSAWVLIRELLKLSIYRHLLIFSFLTTFLRSIFFFWTPMLLVDVGMGNAEGIFKSALFPLLGCVGTVFLGWYTDRFAKNGDRARMMWIMLLCLTLSMLLLSFLLGAKGAEDLPQTAIALLVGACGFFLLGPYSMASGALSLDIAGARAAGTCTGLLDGLGYFGGALAVFVSGSMAEHFGWGQVFLVLAVVALFSTFSAYMMSRDFRSRAHSMALETT